MKDYVVYFLSILFIIMLLSSCSSMLAIGTAAFVGTVYQDPRTIGTQLDDNVIKIHIYNSLYRNQEIRKTSRIVSTVYQGNVLLTGQSPSINLSQEILKIVENIYGVKKVYNAIRLNQPISLQNILLDFLISNQVRLNLFIQKNIHISNIKVITENKEVFLLGKTTQQEGIYAVKIAKNTNGVKKVFTPFVFN